MSLTFGIFRGTEDGKIVPDKTTRILGRNEVFVETTHAGLCGSDEHLLSTGRALGHEGVGIVRQVGQDVQNVKIGDRVGFGFTHYVCNNCENCLTGCDQYCELRKDYLSHDEDLDLGSFSEGVVWDGNCLIPIPEGYDSAYVPPLMCAGATVWTVLTEYGVRPTDRVGIMGLGGLGHLAIKLAAAMGCCVIALSCSNTKRDDAYRFGASEYHVFQPGQEIGKLKLLDHLLLCGKAGVDYASIMPLMSTHGSIYPLTIDLAPPHIPIMEMINKGIRIQGTMVASRHALRKLVHFVNEKKIYPTTMEFPLTGNGIQEAIQRLREGKIRYRAVFVRENISINCLKS